MEVDGGWVGMVCRRVREEREEERDGLLWMMVRKSV